MSKSKFDTGDALLKASRLINDSIRKLQPTQKAIKQAEPFVVSNLEDIKGKLSPNGIAALIKLYPQLVNPVQAQPTPSAQQPGTPSYIRPPGDTFRLQYATNDENLSKDTLANYLGNLKLNSAPFNPGSKQVILQQAKEAKAERFNQEETDGTKS